MKLFTSFWNKHGEKIKSISIGACIAATGAGADYVIHYITTIPVDPNYVPLEVAVLSVLANTLRKFGLPIKQLLFAGKDL